MKRSSAQLALLIFLLLQLSYPLPSLASHRAIAIFCARTHNPRICISATGTFSHLYPDGINSTDVLRMHLAAIARRSTSAKNKAKRLMRRSPPITAVALKNCAGLYVNAVDLIGVSIRALNANDQQTKQMLQIMMQQIRQSAQQCDLQFQRPGIANPMAHFDGSIIKMTINCDDLNAM